MADIWKASIGYTISSAVMVTAIIIFILAVSMIIAVILGVYGVDVDAPWLKVFLVLTIPFLKLIWLGVFILVVPQYAAIIFENMLEGNDG